MRNQKNAAVVSIGHMNRKQIEWTPKTLRLNVSSLTLKALGSITFNEQIYPSSCTPFRETTSRDAITFIVPLHPTRNCNHFLKLYLTCHQSVVPLHPSNERLQSSCRYVLFICNKRKEGCGGWRWPSSSGPGAAVGTLRRMWGGKREVKQAHRIQCRRVKIKVKWQFIWEHYYRPTIEWPTPKTQETKVVLRIQVEPNEVGLAEIA